jgi:hypothetical protein
MSNHSGLLVLALAKIFLDKFWNNMIGRGILIGGAIGVCLAIGAWLA